MPGLPAQYFDQLALARALLKAVMAGLIRRIFHRQLRPVRASAQHPENTMKNRPRIMPWTSTSILAPIRTQDRFHQLPLFFGQFPTACHRAIAEIPEQLYDRKQDDSVLAPRLLDKLQPDHIAPFLRLSDNPTPTASDEITSPHI